MLPAGVKYLVDSCTDNDCGLVALLHANLKTEQQVKEWFKEYSDISLCTFRVSKTFPSGTKILFKVMVILTYYDCTSALVIVSNSSAIMFFVFSLIY